METDYEDFIIKLFSELPTSCLFFKVADKLVFHVFLRKELLRFIGSQNGFDKLRLNLLIMNLLAKGILKSETHTIFEYYWGKNI